MQTDIPRFVMIGGFLGAGKTTTLARLAGEFRSQGKRVVIVTNDQASDLVDTLLLRSQGFDVGEVAGACFCCSFNDLTRTMESLSEDERPDVILAEPVGSCTDLTATVLRPLEQIYDRPLAIAPYGVIIKPSHGFKIFGHSGKGGFSAEAEYIFRKQIEEADFVIINRIDQLSDDQRQEILTILQREFPGTPVVQVSAKTGDGFDALHRHLDAGKREQRPAIELNYDIYAEGEAELGWLNGQFTLEGDEPFSPDDFLIALLTRMRDVFAAKEAEVAHLKAILVWEGGQAAANLIDSRDDPKLSLAGRTRAQRAEGVINARVAVDPELLARWISEAIEQQSEAMHLRSQLTAVQSFRPGRPVPTHRLP